MTVNADIFTMLKTTVKFLPGLHFQISDKSNRGSNINFETADSKVTGTFKHMQFKADFLNTLFINTKQHTLV